MFRDKTKKMSLACGCPNKYMPEEDSWDWDITGTGKCDRCKKPCCWQCGTSFKDDDTGIPEVTSWCGSCSDQNTMYYHSSSFHAGHPK